MTGNQLLNDDQAVGFQLLQAAEHIFAPLFVFLITASIGDLKAPVSSREHPQQIKFRSGALLVSAVPHTCL